MFFVAVAFWNLVGAVALAWFVLSLWLKPTRRSAPAQARDSLPESGVG